jgi:hypothetical protein
MFKRSIQALAVSALVLTGASAHAATVDVLGGSTDLLLSNLGLTGSVTGQGSASSTALGKVISLDITGGTIDDETGAAVLQHAGSSFTLSNGTTSVAFGNLVIDTAAGQVLADIEGGADGAVILQIGNVWEGGELPLLVADSLAAVFPEIEGRKLALGSATPEVPLPASGLLLLGGLGGLAIYRRKIAK